MRILTAEQKEELEKTGTYTLTGSQAEELNKQLGETEFQTLLHERKRKKAIEDADKYLSELTQEKLEEIMME